MHIEIRGVTKSFGRTHALRDFDLSVPPASVIALVGENGAGKSTLLRILAGISVPDEGLVSGVRPRNVTFFDLDSEECSVKHSTRFPQESRNDPEG